MLHEHEAGPKVRELCRRHGISDNTFHPRKRKFGGLQVSEAAAGAGGGEIRLKRMVADPGLQLQVVKYLLGKEW
jgi:putative transposase